METLQKKKINNNIIFITIGIYLFFGNVANYSIYSNLSIILLVGVSAIYILNNKKIYLNIYFLLYVIFMIYQLFLAFSGIAVYEHETIKNIQTMLINLVILMCLYNVIIYTKNMKGFMKVYILISTFSLAVIMFLQRGNLLSGRLAHSWGEDSVSYYFLGKPIAISSNGIAFFSSIAALFSIYFFIKENKKIYLILAIYLTIGVILTGSRKGILILALYSAFIINLMFKRKILLKILIITIVIGGIWILITNVPVLYDIIGERLIDLINLFFGEATTEGSIVARERFKSYALEWISQRPWMGYGSGAFKYIYENVTESNYLEMMVSGGSIGTILYYLYTIPVINRFFKAKEKDNILKILFFILISLLIIDYGSVTYLSRNSLIVIIMYFAYLKIIKINSESDDKNG